MAAGDDWLDTTPAPSPAPKKQRRWPPPDGTGVISIQAGETLAQAIQREGPLAVFKTAIPFAAKATMTIHVVEE
jgi:hypothetical protein